jgi:hypothetical protein
MTYQDDDFDDTWAGLEPPVEPESNYRWGAWLAAGGAILLLTCLCLGGSYYLLTEFERPSAPVPPPPTAIGGPVVSPTFTPGAGATTPAETPATLPTAVIATVIPAATLPVAPTVTLPAVVTLPPAEVTPPPTTSGNVEARQVTTPPIVDGDLSEWVGFPTYESAYVVYTTPGYAGTADTRALWRLAWDAQHLYIGVSVIDAVHVQTQTGNLIYRGDSLDMQFETNYGRRSPQIGPSNFQIIFSPGDFNSLSPSAFRFRGNEQGQIRDFTGHAIVMAAQKTAEGYNLEATIPWSDIGVTPAPGMVLGMALNANDNDTPGTAVQEVMKSHVPTRTLSDPTSWGTLTLN